MNNYLLSWNPERWTWDDLASESEKVLTGEVVERRWSVTKSDKPSPGDGFFLMKVGKQGRGIIACGSILSSPYEDTHYDSEKAVSKELFKYVDIRFELLVNGYKFDYLVTEDELKNVNKDNDIKQHWTPENSGISIPLMAGYTH